MRYSITITLLILVLANVPFAASAQDQLIYLPLDAQGGGELRVFNDPSAKPPATVPGANGNALSFVGKTAVALPFDLDHAKYPQLTLTAWVREPANTSGSRTIVGTPGGMQIGINGGRLSARAGRTGVSMRTARFPSEQWVFVAAVLDMEAGWIRLIQDDEVYVQEGLDTSFRPPALLRDPDDRLAEAQPWVIIGAAKFLPWQRYARALMIDDVRVFSGLLSDESLRALARRPTGPQALPGDMYAGTDPNALPGDMYEGTDPNALPGDMYEGDGTDPNALPGDMYEGDGTDPEALPGDMYDGDGTNPEALPGDMYDPTQPAIADVLVDISGTPGADIDEGALIEQTNVNQPPIVRPTQLPGDMYDADSGDSMTAEDVSNAAGDLAAPIDPTGAFDEIGFDRPDMQYASEEEGEAAAAAAEQRRRIEAEQAAEETREQALQPATSFVPTGDAVFSDLSGHRGDNRDRLDLRSAFFAEIHWSEKFDRPCRISIDEGTRGEAERERLLYCDKADFGLFDKRVGIEVDGVYQPVRAIKVCNNGNNNHRLKGIQIFAGTVTRDGRRTDLPDADSEVLNNCAVWDDAVSCPADMLATGLLVHADEPGPLASSPHIVGLQLICRRIAVTNP